MILGNFLLAALQLPSGGGYVLLKLGELLLFILQSLLVLLEPGQPGFVLGYDLFYLRQRRLRLPQLGFVSRL